VLELNALPRSGPFLHVHHREDEWYYVLFGEFIFRANGDEFNLPAGGSIWLPRGIPHVWCEHSYDPGPVDLDVPARWIREVFRRDWECANEQEEPRHDERGDGEIWNGDAGSANFCFLMDATAL